MKYITNIERIGYKRGFEEGLKLGMEKAKKIIRQGEFEIVAKVIARMFGLKTDNILSLIQPLSSEELGELADSFFGFENFDVFCEWVQKRTAGRTEQP